MIGCIQRCRGVFLQPLCAVPCHVLDSEERSVCAEEHVEVAGADDGVVRVLDNALEDAIISGADGSILCVAAGVAVAEDIDVCALEPVAINVCVQGELDISAVEVYFCARRGVVSRVDYAELRVWVRAGLGDVVDIEAWVDFEDGAVKVVELIACVVVRGEGIRKHGEGSLGWRKCKVLLIVLGVATVFLMLTDRLHEGVVEVQKVLPELNIGKDDDLLLDRFVSNDGIINGDTSQVEVLIVIGLDEAVRNIWDVIPSVRLSSDISLPVIQFKEINEALVKATELGSKFDFIGDIGCSLRVTHANRLFNPKYIGEVVPAVGILDGS